MFIIFAGSRILFVNSLKSISGEFTFLSITIKKNRAIIAATPKPITISTFDETDALTVCMNCNATRNETTVIDSVIAPIRSIVDLFLLIEPVLLSAYSVVVVVLLLSE